MQVLSGVNVTYEKQNVTYEKYMLQDHKLVIHPYSMHYRYKVYICRTQNTVISGSLKSKNNNVK